MSWRNRLLPASFRGVPFHFEDNERAGGRRGVVHEYPKRNTGYAEDMGRRQRTFRVRGYTIGANYDLQVRLLELACEADGPALLVLPTRGPSLVLCNGFAAMETREEGGFATIDMDFVEAGSAPSAAASINTGEAVSSAADAASASVAASPMSGIGHQ
ncbi:DNA circularization N-terminal domain-containing protein [Kaistia dalseonensis]|uniref:Prophage DNA circulation protein n=1 Tax=Kaistia dalseonensis TaxID=410840 RepID=A0ABU0H9S1_9HYPH|nr:DNA circularization N-terminal domain-containing protein [Kaistia dalseonensis]MCX5496431.1 DNA circularization N-terminal domain-containing protein [Kaistia dalseonensis]MDQ0439051.1 prophage DNA circulation protein [Kaistia dalseonensis]